MQGFGTVVAGTVLGGRGRDRGRGRGLPGRPPVAGPRHPGPRRADGRLGPRPADGPQPPGPEERGAAARPGRRGPGLAHADRQARRPARCPARASAKDVKHRDRVRLHIGTDEVMARLALLEGQTVGPGGSALVQLILERPAVALPGDRFVIRSFSPLVTIGGGKVLDAEPGKAQALQRRGRRGDEAAGRGGARGGRAGLSPGGGRPSERQGLGAQARPERGRGRGGGAGARRQKGVWLPSRAGPRKPISTVRFTRGSRKTPRPRSASTSRGAPNGRSCPTRTSGPGSSSAATPRL